MNSFNLQLQTRVLCNNTWNILSWPEATSVHNTLYPFVALSEASKTRIGCLHHRNDSKRYLSTFASCILAQFRIPAVMLMRIPEQKGSAVNFGHFGHKNSNVWNRTWIIFVSITMHECIFEKRLQCKAHVNYSCFFSLELNPFVITLSRR